MNRLSTFNNLGFPLAAAFSGFLLSLPWLDQRTFPAAWIGMVVLTAITSGQPAYLAFRVWLLGGLVTVGMWFHWLPWVVANHLEVSLASGLLVTLLVVTWDAFRFGVFGYLVAVVRPPGASGIIVLPILWVALEWAWPHVFPWRIGQSQLGWLAFCQIAEFTGAYGVSFLFVWGAAALAALLRTMLQRAAAREKRGLLLHALLCGIVLSSAVGFGVWRVRSIESAAADQPILKVALVQPGMRDDQMLATLRKLSFQVGDQADLAVWGESSVAAFSRTLARFDSDEEVRAAARQDIADQAPCPGLGRPLLCGGATFAPVAKETGPLWNTAFLIAADESIVGRYDKRVLMPWGEYAVGQQWIPGLRGLLAEGDALVAGNSPSPLELPGLARLGVLICYEDVLPAPARQTVLAGANVLVNLNNLDVFGRTAALYEHQVLAKFRAIENCRWLVRCGITGSTAVISATGRVVEQAPTSTPTAVVAGVPLVRTLTFYSQFGDVFAWLCTAAGIVSLAPAWLPPWRPIRAPGWA